ncbi:hypothetical protein [Lacrimispora sp.]|uniref:hypothetical protein n=1 Tax=Lacrimispora sp. TaxID=2719234 RepID=UPI00399432A9
MKEDKLIENIKSKNFFVDCDYDKYYPRSRFITSLGNGTVVYVLNEDTKEWDNCINELYKSLCKVEKDVSFQEFTDYIHKLIRLDEFSDFNSIISYYEKLPLKEFDFIKVAYGMTINEIDYIDHNGMTLIKKGYLEEYLKKNISDSESASFFYTKLKTDDNVIYMKISCTAKDSQKAHEYAIQRFKIIDICFRFLLKKDNSNELRIGFYNLNYESISGMLGYNKNTFISISENKNSVNIDKYINYIFESNISINVWSLMGKQDLNDMQKRIKEAIIWISEATHQNDDGIAYMQCFLALEALLMEQDGFINKSITAQISEYVAFILSEEKRERIIIEKEIKRLYTIRSSIAHGKNKKDVYVEIEKIFGTVKAIVVKFLTDKKLMGIHNVRELREYITDLKFK